MWPLSKWIWKKYLRIGLPAAKLPPPHPKTKTKKYPKRKKDKDPCVGGYKKMVKRGRSGDGPTTVRHTA